MVQCFAYAEKLGASKAIFVMPEEWKNGCVVVKDLKNREDQKGIPIKFENLILL